MLFYNELHNILFCEQYILDACDVYEIDQQIGFLQENCVHYCNDATQTPEQIINSIRYTLESLKNVKAIVVDQHLSKTRRRLIRPLAVITDVLNNQNIVIGSFDYLINTDVYKRIDIKQFNPTLTGRQSLDIMNQIQQWFQKMAAIMCDTLNLIEYNIRLNPIYQANIHQFEEIYNEIRSEFESLIQLSFVVIQQPPEVIMRIPGNEKKME